MVVNTLLQINETNRISNVYVHFITHREWTPTLQVLQKSTGLVFQSSSYFLISYLDIFYFIYLFFEFNTHVKVVVVFLRILLKGRTVYTQCYCSFFNTIRYNTT